MPRFSRPSRAAVMFAAVSLVGLGGLAGGCDDKSSSAAAQIDAAETAAESAFGSAPGAAAGTPAAEDAASKAKKALAAVNPTVTADAPAPYQVRAAALLAAANDRVAANELARAGDLRLKAERLIGDLHRRALDVQFSAAIVDGFQQLDPKASLAQIDQTLAGVQSGQTWSPGQGSQGGPTLQAVDGEIARLQQQIKDGEAKGADLTSRRTDLLTQSEQFAQQAQVAKGQASVAAFTKGSDLRKQANDLATDKTVLDAGLEPMRADLALAQARKQALGSAVQTLQAQKQAVQDGWESVKTQIAQLRTANESVLSGSEGAAPSSATPSSGPAGGSGADPSVSQMAAELQTTLNELEKAVKAADDTLSASAKGYGSASDTAKTAATALQAEAASAGPRGDVYRALADSLSPQFYRLREAGVRSVAAELYAGEFGRLARQRAMLAAVRSAAEAAGGQSPAAAADAPVGGDLDARLAAAADKASKAFDAAVSDFSNVSSGTAPAALKSAAATGQMFANYGWSTLNRMQADAGVGDGAAAHADEHLRAARDAYAGAKQQADAAKSPLPYLPPELTGETAKPTTAPATGAGATSQPATPPAPAGSVPLFGGPANK